MIYRFLFAVLLTFPLLTLANTENNFLVISDIHLDVNSSHAMEISPQRGNIANDLDLTTFKALMAKIHDSIAAGKISKPQFVLLLGDIVGHIRIGADSVITSESKVFNELKSNFPNIPIFYTFGNNDSLASNYGPFKDRTKSPYTSAYDVAKQAANWSDGFLSTGVLCEQSPKTFPCLISENTNSGYYDAYIQLSFRLISLNTVMFSRHSNPSPEEAKQELQWLETQLKVATTNHETVLITMHIPFGNNVYDHTNFWNPTYQTTFLQLLKTYKESIVGVLAAHTHNDELKIIKDATGNTITGIYLTAALSTSHGNAPSVKTFYFAKSKNSQWQITNYKSFYFSMNNNHLDLTKLYDYQGEYCPFVAVDLYACLDNVTINQLHKYYTAGNKNNVGMMSSPEDMVFKIPNTPQ